MLKKKQLKKSLKHWVFSSRTVKGDANYEDLLIELVNQRKANKWLRKDYRDIRDSYMKAQDEIKALCAELREARAAHAQAHGQVDTLIREMSTIREEAVEAVSKAICPTCGTPRPAADWCNVCDKTPGELELDAAIARAERAEGQVARLTRCQDFDLNIGSDATLGHTCRVAGCPTDEVCRHCQNAAELEGKTGG